MSVFSPAEGTFGWGFPEWGRPRIEIVSRYRIAEPTGGIGQLAVVDVESGTDPAIRARLTVACVSSDSAAIVRGLAFQKFAQELRDYADHIESLADEAGARDSEVVWRDSLIDLDE